MIVHFGREAAEMAKCPVAVTGPFIIYEEASELNTRLFGNVGKLPRQLDPLLLFNGGIGPVSKRRNAHDP